MIWGASGQEPLSEAQTLPPNSMGSQAPRADET
ncbi:MAG: hypothetical protein QOF30_81 [Acidimicrobiaceae bacterium]|jgi:hypothetical protein|nr:hypothetical protein [Acidimicrobiaceae bacterium]